jgi:hypothetical protein
MVEDVIVAAMCVVLGKTELGLESDGSSVVMDGHSIRDTLIGSRARE